MKKILTITAMLLVVSLAFFSCDTREYSGEGKEAPVVAGPPKVFLKKGDKIARSFTTTAIVAASTADDAGNQLFFQTAEEKHTLGAVTLTFTKFTIKVGAAGTVVDLADELGGTFELPKNPYGKDNTDGGNATMGFQGKTGIFGLVGQVGLGDPITVELEFTANRDIMDDIEWGIADTNAAVSYWKQLTTSIKLTDDDDPAFD